MTLDREYIFQFPDDAETAVTTDNINAGTIVPKEYVEATKYTVTFRNLDYDNWEWVTVGTQTVYDGDCAENPGEPAFIGPDADEYEFTG